MTLPADAEAAIVMQARGAAPNECCGLLIGKGRTVVEAVAAANIAADPTRRYLVDPRDHLAALRRARAAHLEVVGGYHSHPYSAATPSPTDIADGFAEFLYLIVGLGGTEPELSAWTWDAGNFTRLPLVRAS